MILTKNKEILNKYMPTKDLIDEVKKSIAEHKKENPEQYRGLKYTKEDYIRCAISKMCNKKFVKKNQSILFKDMADVMLSELNKMCTIENIDFGDGYFIFDMGQNSVVHFNVKELPGWKFAFWFAVDTKQPTNIHYHWFCQQELFCDKFKPSRSAITYESTICTSEFIYSMLEEESNNESIIWGIDDNIKYMLEHPYLAAYRDSHGVDFNTYYITERKAKRAIKREIKKENKRNQLKDEAEQLMKDKVVDMLKESTMIAGFEVHDQNEDGWICHPRYDITISIDESLEEFADDIYYEFNDKIEKLQEKICKKRRYKDAYVFHSVNLHSVVLVNSEQTNEEKD